MQFIETQKCLTHKAVMAMLAAGIEKAEADGQPQCIVIVDASGEVQGEIRMTGAKFLSRKSAFAKAQTAASIRGASNNVPEDFRPGIGMATGGAVTGLPGGLPIMVDGQCVGGIGVGSGSGDQDIAVGNAMLAALDAGINA